MSSPFAKLTRSFEARDLDASAFSHLNHVGVAYEMLRRYEFMDAAKKYADNINEIATKAGAPRKFNTTITIAFMSLIAERMAATQHDGCEDFMSNNQDLLSKDVLGRWYTADRLNSDLARRIFLMPNACP